MNKENTGFISKLLLDATLLEMRAVVPNTETTVFEPSYDYNEKIKAILAGEYKSRAKRPAYKYLLIAAVIAALLLLAACVITLDYIIRYEENSIVVTPQPGETEHRDKIESYYTLSYVPEGYEQVEFSPTEYSAYTL